MMKVLIFSSGMYGDFRMFWGMLTNTASSTTEPLNCSPSGTVTNFQVAPGNDCRRNEENKDSELLEKRNGKLVRTGRKHRWTKLPETVTPDLRRYSNWKKVEGPGSRPERVEQKLKESKDEE